MTDGNPLALSAGNRSDELEARGAALPELAISFSPSLSPGATCARRILDVDGRALEPAAGAAPTSARCPGAALTERTAVTDLQSPEARRSLFAAQLAQCFALPERMIEARFGAEAFRHSRSFRGLPLLEAFSDHQRNVGVTPAKDPFELIQASYRLELLTSPRVLATYSTVDQSFNDVAQMIVQECYGEANQVAPWISAPVSVSNFRRRTVYRFEQVGEFEKVAPGVELKDAALHAGSSVTSQLETRAQKVVITREMVLNDDKEAIRGMIRNLTKRAAIALERVLIEALAESSDDFFSAANGNRLTSKPLSATNLPLAYAALWAQRELSGAPFYCRPAVLLVPPSLQYLAGSLFAGFMAEDKLRVLTSPFLELPSVDGNSSSTWYVLADPRIVPTLQAVYLEGNTQPLVASRMVDQFVMETTVMFDFSVDRINPHGAIKATA